MGAFRAYPRPYAGSNCTRVLFEQIEGVWELFRARAGPLRVKLQSLYSSKLTILNMGR